MCTFRYISTVCATAYIRVPTLLSDGYLSLGMHLNTERGIVLKQTTKKKVKEVHSYEMKIYISIKTFGNFIGNHLHALHVSVSAYQ